MVLEQSDEVVVGDVACGDDKEAAWCTAKQMAVTKVAVLEFEPDDVDGRHEAAFADVYDCAPRFPVLPTLGFGQWISTRSTWSSPSVRRECTTDRVARPPGCRCSVRSKPTCDVVLGGVG